MNQIYNLLSCWHKLEHFSPANLPRSNKVKEIESILPWDKPINLILIDRTIEYTIYLGVINSSIVKDFVKNFFNDQTDDINPRSENICFASFKVDINGCYITNSFGISTLPWALSQLEKDAIKHDNWSKAFNLVKDDLLVRLENDLNEKVTINTIRKIQDNVIEVINWSVKITPKIYFKTEEKYKSNRVINEDENNTDILNSFYIEDIEKIISSIDYNHIPIPFSKYIQGSLNQYGKRFDLKDNVGLIKDSLSPENYPDGTWPSKHSLSLMQQYAVNTIYGQLANNLKGDILSVNGPPGTGKTTLLRDIIAAIIVDRAKKLANYKDPNSAYKVIGAFINNKNFENRIYQLDDNLCETGIVIASSNNGAVENVSKELPLKKEVTPFENQVGYFQDVAENCIDPNYWGLISAVLGNKNNISNLVFKLWYNNGDGSINLRAKLQLKTISIEEWGKSICNFKEKQNAVNEEKTRLKTLKKQYEEFKEIKRKLEVISKDIEDVKRKCNYSFDVLGSKQIELLGIKEQKEKALLELTQISKTKPSFFTYLFNKQLRILYKKSYNNAFNNFHNFQVNYDEKSILIQNIEFEYRNLKSFLKQTSELYESLIAQHENYKIKTENARKELQANYADDEFWLNFDSKQSQESCPWYSTELKRLQSELFISALQLHETFILYTGSNSRIIDSSISSFFDYIKGNFKKRPSPNEVKALWNIFFLLIPVISTTFASVQTMFKDLEKCDLPWLFIDEAGQAVPQAALGAIWRSKRVVVVGDPFQIEPVVTIPNAITNNLSKHFGLTLENINSELSVQVMADRINPLGMNIKDNWVGIPLRVHRRCINPMFRISNSIAYDNKMVLSTTEPKSINLNMKSSFINVVGNVEGKHWVKEQGNKVVELVIKEIQFSKNFPDIFIISPFAEVSSQLIINLSKPIKQEISKHINGISDYDINIWLDSHVGTVHTFQGKQADGVIMCLGLDNNTKGAANWASSKPNLLNVALTRAKYRFVAIGDKDIWLKVKNFKMLAYLSE